MQEKPSEELDRVEGHDPLTIAPLIVFPSERYLTVLQNDQAPLGDGHTMGVARQILEALVRPCQWRFGIDDPLHLPQRRKKLAPGLWSAPLLALSLHAEVVLRGCLPQRRQERAPKASAEDADREKEAFGACDPRCAIQRQATRWDETMDVGMMTTTVTIP
jgi:hypothetical protein